MGGTFSASRVFIDSYRYRHYCGSGNRQTVRALCNFL